MTRLPPAEWRPGCEPIGPVGVPDLPPAGNVPRVSRASIRRRAENRGEETMTDEDLRDLMLACLPEGPCGAMASERANR